MSFFDNSQVATVQIDDQNTVTVRRLTFGETQDVLSESTVFDIVAKQGRLDFAKHQIAKLTRAVVAWDGPGFAGRPVNAANIAALPPHVGEKIAQAVSQVNDELEDADQKK